MPEGFQDPAQREMISRIDAAGHADVVVNQGHETRASRVDACRAAVVLQQEGTGLAQIQKALPERWRSAGKFVYDELVDHAGSATERSLQQLGIPMDAPGHPYGTVRLADPGALSCRERSLGASGATPGAIRR